MNSGAVSLAAAIASSAAAIASAVAAIFSARSSNKSSAAAQRAADVAEATERRERTPQLDVSMVDGAENKSQATYRVTNHGPQDIDSVTVPRPVTSDNVVHPVATNPPGAWGDSVDFGPLAMGESREFKLNVGHPHALERDPSSGYARWLSEITVVIACRAGKDSWNVVKRLEPPR